MAPGDAQHQTIGSDILAVLKTLKHPKEILGVEWVERLSVLQPNDWYPIRLLLDLLDALDKRTGSAAILAMGRELFRMSHQARLTPDLKSAGDVLYGIDGMYHHANRGTDIGGWQVLRFQPGVGVLRKTTPHHCALEEGILHEALHIVGADSLIVQSKCMRRGEPACEFELRSAVRDQRWVGTHPLGG